MERLKEIKRIYKDLNINDSGHSNNMPDNELKTNFLTGFNINYVIRNGALS